MIKLVERIGGVGDLMSRQYLLSSIDNDTHTHTQTLGYLAAYSLTKVISSRHGQFAWPECVHNINAFWFITWY